MGRLRRLLKLKMEGFPPKNPWEGWEGKDTIFKWDGWKVTTLLPSVPWGMDRKSETLNTSNNKIDHLSRSRSYARAVLGYPLFKAACRLTFSSKVKGVCASSESTAFTFRGWHQIRK